ncbi:hypothetical protein C8R44DRAFT_883104 [Mycena epipterygia]|nr:hypothetical protein C8R44DRAFT_883104 [Mycena epipterygia]
MELVEVYFKRAGTVLESLGMGLLAPDAICLNRCILRHTTILQTFMFICPNPLDILDHPLGVLPISCNEIIVHVLEPGNGEAHWIELAATLAEPRFWALKRFHLTGLVILEKQRLETMMRHLIPLVNAREILD